MSQEGGAVGGGAVSVEEGGGGKHYTCDICSVICTDLNMYNLHVQGKKHQKESGQAGYQTKSVVYLFIACLKIVDTYFDNLQKSSFISNSP